MRTTSRPVNRKLSAGSFGRRSAVADGFPSDAVGIEQGRALSDLHGEHGTVTSSKSTRLLLEGSDSAAVRGPPCHPDRGTSTCLIAIRTAGREHKNKGHVSPLPWLPPPPRRQIQTPSPPPTTKITYHAFQRQQTQDTVTIQAPPKTETAYQYHRRHPQHKRLRYVDLGSC